MHTRFLCTENNKCGRGMSEERKGEKNVQNRKRKKRVSLVNCRTLNWKEWSDFSTDARSKVKGLSMRISSEYFFLSLDNDSVLFIRFSSWICFFFLLKSPEQITLVIQCLASVWCSFHALRKKKHQQRINNTWVMSD